MGVGLQSATRHKEGTVMPSAALGRRTTHMSIKVSGDLMVVSCNIYRVLDVEVAIIL